MSIRFIEGFDNYVKATDANRKWQIGNLGISTLQNGRDTYGKSLKFLGPHSEDAYLVTPSLGNASTLIIGFAFKDDNMPSAPFKLLSFMDLSDSQIDLYFDPSTHNFSFRRAIDDIVGTGTRLVSDNTWVYVEVKATIHSSTGSVQLKINEQSDITVTGANTQASANGHNYANTISFFKPSAYSTSYSLDDLYILDSNGSANNDFLGDMKVEALVPIGTGTNSGWTAVGDSPNWKCVVSNNATYVETSTLNAKDTYQISDLTYITNAIAGIGVNIFVKNTDGQSNHIKSVIRSGGVDNDSAASNFVNDVDFKCQTFVQETDPNTSSAWTAAALNSAEFGMKLLA